MYKILISNLLQKIPEIKQSLIPPFFESLYSQYSFDEKVNIFRKYIDSENFLNTENESELYKELVNCCSDYYNFKEHFITIKEKYPFISDSDKNYLFAILLLNKDEVFIKNESDIDFEYKEFNTNKKINRKYEVALNFWEKFYSKENENTASDLKATLHECAEEYSLLSKLSKKTYIETKIHYIINKFINLTSDEFLQVDKKSIDLIKDTFFSIPLDKENIYVLKSFIMEQESNNKLESHEPLDKIKRAIFENEELAITWLKCGGILFDNIPIPDEFLKNSVFIELINNQFISSSPHSVNKFKKIITNSWLNDMENIEMLHKHGNLLFHLCSNNTIFENYMNKDVKKFIKYLSLQIDGSKSLSIIFSKKPSILSEDEVFKFFFNSSVNSLFFHVKSTEIMLYMKDSISKYINDFDYNQKKLNTTQIKLIFSEINDFPVDIKVKWIENFISTINFEDWNYDLIESVPFEKISNIVLPLIAKDKYNFSRPRAKNLIEYVMKKEKSKEYMLNENIFLLELNLFYDKNNDPKFYTQYIKSFDNSVINNDNHLSSKIEFPAKCFFNKDFCIQLVSNNFIKDVKNIPVIYFKDINFLIKFINKLNTVDIKNHHHFFKILPPGIETIISQTPGNIALGEYLSKFLLHYNIKEETKKYHASPQINHGFKI